jgi:hypothetical protein
LRPFPAASPGRIGQNGDSKNFGHQGNPGSFFQTQASVPALQ